VTGSGHSHIPSPAWGEHAERVLHDAGLRSSAGRSAVVRFLSGQQCLLSAQEIAARLREEHEAGSQATVYRTLDTLHQLGLLHRVDGGDGVARFEPADPSGEHHHHLIDEESGEIVSFEDAELERAIEGLSERLGFDITAHDVILRGRRR
jgi:Fur family transcriptional regulator, ferric uptake regulator